jgi:hypothetical protein|tara:strand:+ start:143 stop:406 length:264 start_codon:yes stop_codon:yes gene_type:complete
MIKEFQVRIYAYGYRTKFNMKCEDSAESIEQSIVDRLGQSDIKWDETGFYDTRKKWITYEEVHDASTLERPLQTKEVLGVKLGTGAS